MPPEDAPATEYPTSIGRTARRVLAERGCTRWSDLTGFTARELLAIHGVGPKAVRILTEELRARGLSLADG